MNDEMKTNCPTSPTSMINIMSNLNKIIDTYFISRICSAKKHLLISAICATTYMSSIVEAYPQITAETSIPDEKSYTKIENNRELDIALRDMGVDIKVHNFLKEINNNHSYKISIFFIMKITNLSLFLLKILTTQRVIICHRLCMSSVKEEARYIDLKTEVSTCYR